MFFFFLAISFVSISSGLFYKLLFFSHQALPFYSLNFCPRVFCLLTIFLLLNCFVLEGILVSTQENKYDASYSARYSCMQGKFFNPRTYFLQTVHFIFTTMKFFCFLLLSLEKFMCTTLTQIYWSGLCLSKIKGKRCL